MASHELHLNYEGLELLIKATNVGGNFDNDFEMYKLSKHDRILLMTYKERWGERGYCIEVSSRGILKKDYIEKMLHTLLPLTTLIPNAQLIIHEEV